MCMLIVSIIRQKLAELSSTSFSVNSAICQNFRKVHFAQVPYVGGIVEFMSIPFLQKFYKNVYADSQSHGGDLTKLDWSKYQNITEIDCIPLHSILHFAKVHHINFFILDVEVSSQCLYSEYHSAIRVEF